MGAVFPIVGPPGALTPTRVTFRRVFEGIGSYLSLPGGVFIDGTKSRDPANVGFVGTLEPGLLMGIITASGYMAPSVFGPTLGTTSANGTPYTSGGTSICVSPQAATEIVRRIGNSGNLIYAGPTTANGAVTPSAAIAFSAVNTTTGVITISSIGANMVLGGLVCPTDGSQTPITFIPEGSGIQVVDGDGNSVSYVQFPIVPIAGVIASPGSGPNAGLVNWPTDTGIQAYIAGSLNSATWGATFRFMTLWQK